MNLANKAFSVLGRDFFLLFSNLITSIIIARTLGPEIMGIWVILNSVPSYAEMLGRSKVDLAAVYFLGKGKYQIGDIASCLNIIAIVTSILIIVPIMLFFEPLSVALLKSEVDFYSTYLILILLVIPLNFLYLNYMYLHVHNENVKAINAMVLTRALSMSGGAVLGVLLFGFLIPELVACFIGSYILGFGVGIYKSSYSARKGPILNFSLLKDLFRYAYKVYLAGLLINLNNYISNTFIIFYGSPSQVTFFALAQQFGQILGKIIESMNTFIFPSASKKDNDESVIFITKAFRVAIIIMIPLGILSSIGIYPAVYFLYGSKYLPIVSPFLILLPGIVFSSITGTLLIYFMSSGRPEIITKTLFIPVIVQLALGFWAVPVYGLNGAAAILVLGMMIASCTQVIIFCHLTKVDFSKRMVVQKDDLITVTGFIRSILKY